MGSIERSLHIPITLLGHLLIPFPYTIPSYHPLLPSPHTIPSHHPLLPFSCRYVTWALSNVRSTFQFVRNGMWRFGHEKYYSIMMEFGSWAIYQVVTIRCYFTRLLTHFTLILIYFTLILTHFTRLLVYFTLTNPTNTLLTHHPINTFLTHHPINVRAFLTWS